MATMITKNTTLFWEDRYFSPLKMTRDCDWPIAAVCVGSSGGRNPKGGYGWAEERCIFLPRKKGHAAT